MWSSIFHILFRYFHFTPCIDTVTDSVIMLDESFQNSLNEKNTICIVQMFFKLTGMDIQCVCSSACVSLSTALLPVVEGLHGITVTPEMARAFVTNLGFDAEEFQSLPGDLLSICHLWMDRRNICYVEELTVALVHTTGLGRFTPRLCDHGKYGWGNYLLLVVYELLKHCMACE